MAKASMRERVLVCGLGVLGLVLCCRGLLAGPASLGTPRPCTRAQLVAGVLRCEEELIQDSAGLCALGPAIEPEPKRASLPESGASFEHRGLCEAFAKARMPPAQLAALAQPVELNTAAVSELASLPGIGPKIGARIVEGRPYVELEQLLEVRGIGPKRLAAVRSRVWIRERRSQ